MIADAFSEVDMVTVENSQTTSTYVEIIKGMKIDRGYASRVFVNDFKKQECVLDNPYILISDHEINNIMNLERILVPIVSQGRSLLIIGELGQNALNTLNANVAGGKIKACSILPPSFGYRKKDLLEDLSVALGGVYFSEDTGDDLSLIDLDSLGRATKVIVSNNMTVFMHSESREDAIISRVAELKEMRDASTNDDEKNFLNERIANLSGGVGVIYVGALSDIEQKEKKDRIDDAVCAVQAALEDGILPGGGVALLDIGLTVCIHNTAADKIMGEALRAPFKQIVTNAGKNCDEILMNRPMGDGYDVKGEQYGDMVKLGIIDPTKVTKNALLNAVSVATTIMSTNAIITNIRDYEGSK
jgi:chaperonin GroEL